ncbi:hypothetical protein FRC11_009237 [Ceratobasidium sp. 423]|nr:hypothetical protein FRC11_009237 [Ceratobasidium sp. 423]
MPVRTNHVLREAKVVTESVPTQPGESDSVSNRVRLAHVGVSISANRLESPHERMTGRRNRGAALVIRPDSASHSLGLTIGPVTTLNIIKAIEELGGSRGYLAHLKSANPINQLTRPLSLLSVSNPLSSDAEATRHSHNCSVYLRAGIVPGTLFGEIKVFDKPEEEGSARVKYFTRIRAWLTKGNGFTDLHGNFVLLTGWEDMLEGPMKFHVMAAEGQGAHIVFKRDFLPLAEISADFPEATGTQCGSYEGEGECTWDQMIYV